MPTSRSRVAICWLTADCDMYRVSAAAENEPLHATSLRILRRFVSSISTAYQSQQNFLLRLFAGSWDRGDITNPAPSTLEVGDVQPPQDNRKPQQRNGRRLDPLDRHRRGSPLAVVAARDSQRLPDGPWLVAEVEGAPLAVLSLETGSFVADPFSRTVELRALLELRADQLGSREPAQRRFGRPRRESVPGAGIAPRTEPAGDPGAPAQVLAGSCRGFHGRASDLHLFLLLDHRTSVWSDRFGRSA